MRELNKEERRFLKKVLRKGWISYTQNKKRGYIKLEYGGKKYKRSRLIMQLHLNKKLEIWEVVHHKDGNSTNDEIKNLKVMSSEDHTSHHCAGRRKNVSD